jgi:hypothetical protein
MSFIRKLMIPFSHEYAYGDGVAGWQSYFVFGPFCTGFRADNGEIVTSW